MLKPLILGISGPDLTTQEIDLFTEHEVVGFILFSRNIQTTTQLKNLTHNLKNLYPHKKTPIFVDQEGGRVARIKPPIAQKLFPNAEYFDQKYQSNPEQVIRELKMNYTELVSELKELGIDSPCGPVCDLRIDNASDVIGDRSFGRDPVQVTTLCSAAITAISDAHAIPFIKHIPGHGRAMVDSHFDLPIIDTDLSILKATDFMVFKKLAKKKVWGMTAHIIYQALDPVNPATCSPKVIKYIRENIGFDGILISDDICMCALHDEIGKNHLILTKILKLEKENKEWKEQYTNILDNILNIDSHDLQSLNHQTVIDKCSKKLDEIKPLFISSLIKKTDIALDAGCNIVLHCSGDFAEMSALCRNV